MKPIRKTDVRMKVVGGESVLYRTNEKAVHVLNATAKLIWELCDGKHTETDIEKAIRSNFSVPKNHDVVADVRNTLEGFATKNLLVLA